MKPVITNGLWALLVIGAYLIGITQQPGREASSPSPGSGNGSKSVRSSQTGSTSARGTAPRGDAGSRWLDPYRGSDRRIAADHIEAIVASILLESDLLTATLHFAQLLEDLTPENAPAILQALQASGGSGKSADYLELLAHAWGRMDGRTAVAAFASMRGRAGETAKAAALAAWAAIDPVTAMAWWDDQRVSTDDPRADRRANEGWTRGLLTGLARRDLAMATDYFARLSPDEQRDQVEVLLEAKLKDGVLASADWALQLPDEPLRTGALESVGMTFLRQDLDAASKWAASIADRPDAHEAVADVADALASRNPTEAAAWVAALPPGPSQNHAYEDLFENWTRSDPVAAGQSLTTMEPGTARDTAIQAFSRHLLRANPEDALGWAGAITDAQQRGEVQVELARRWQKDSPADAAAWVTVNLPADLQVRVLPTAP